MTYKADSNQIGFLQILSGHATQNVTYHCKKSVAYYDDERKTHRYGLKLLAWNDAELTPKGSHRLSYTALEDGCKSRTDDWSRSVLSYTTDKATRLPIIDISIRDIGSEDQEFWVEIGAVCFYTDMISRN